MPFNGQSSWAGFSPDGKYVAPIGKTTGFSSIRSIQVREAASGTAIGEALQLNADLVAADFSPDSQLMAVVTGIHGDPAQLRIWNWRTGSLVCKPVQFDSEPVWTCFAPDGKAVAVHCMNGEAFPDRPNKWQPARALDIEAPAEPGHVSLGVRTRHNYVQP